MYFKEEINKDRESSRIMSAAAEGEGGNFWYVLLSWYVLLIPEKLLTKKWYGSHKSENVINMICEREKKHQGVFISSLEFTIA